MPNRYIQSYASSLISAARRSYPGAAGLQYLNDLDALLAENDLTRTQFQLSLANLSETFNATGALTAAQILTLHSVPVALIAAPGAGKTIVIEEFFYVQTFGTVQFAAGGAVSPVYHGKTTALTSTLAAATINGAATFSALLAIAGATTTGGGNLGVDLLAATQDFTTGDSTAQWYARYRIIPVAL